MELGTDCICTALGFLGICTIFFATLLNFVSHFILQKYTCHLKFFTIVQTLNFLGEMLTVGWAPCQVSWGQSALNPSRWKSTWVIAANYAHDKDTQPPDGSMCCFTRPQLHMIYQNFVWEQEHTQDKHTCTCNTVKQETFEGEIFRELVIFGEKLLQIAWFCHAKGCLASKFCGENLCE